MPAFWHDALPAECKIVSTLDVVEIAGFLTSLAEFAIDTEGRPTFVVQIGTDSRVLVTHVNQFRQAMRLISCRKWFVFWDMTSDNPWALGINPRFHRCSDAQAEAPRYLGPYEHGRLWGLCNAYNKAFDTHYEKDLHIVTSPWTAWPLQGDKLRYACMDVFATYRLAVFYRN